MIFKFKIIAALAAVLALGACNMKKDRSLPLPEEGKPINPGLATVYYTQALQKKQEEGCAEAIPVLSRLAEWGRGYEIVQYHLGVCLLETGEAATDPAEKNTSQAKGMEWLVLAANSSNVDSQGKLAEVYISGFGTATDKIEAGKWFLIYGKHPFHREIGARELAPGVESELNTQLTSQEWAEARLRADEWQSTTQEVKVPTPEREKNMARPGDIRRRRRR